MREVRPEGPEQGSTNWLLDEMRNGRIFELPIAMPYEYNAGDRTMNRTAESDVGEPVEFSADSFQMPFDVPGDREYKYKGKIIAQRGDILTVKLTSPKWAVGKVVKINQLREDTLMIGSINRQAVARELLKVAKDLAAFDAGKLDVAKKVLRVVGKIPGAYLTTYKNGRENGFALSKGGKKVVFSENRNSDDIVVYFAEDEITGFDDNNIPSEETYRNKKYFRYDDFDGAARFIRSFLR